LGYLAVALRECAEQSWFAAIVRVHVGDQVRAGDAIGKLGSSGNSTEPHLLFRVCDKPDPLMCVGIPLNFSNVTVQWSGLPCPSKGGTFTEARRIVCDFFCAPALCKLYTCVLKIMA